MRTLISALVVALLIPCMALAAQCLEYSTAGLSGAWFSDPDGACQDEAAKRKAANPTDYWGNPNTYTVAVCTASQWQINRQDGTNYQGSMQTRAVECASACPKDAAIQVNVTVGYSRTPGGADGKMAVVVSRPWEGGATCYNGCQMVYGSPVAAWWSEAPTSSGLYRGSMDMNVTGNGQTCSDDNDPAMSQVQENGPDCTGSVGQVNGKPYCAGTAQNPVANDHDINSPLPGNKGNPATGSVGNGGTGPDRTPSTGVGGPRGGPGGVGSVLTPGGGGSGSGTVNKPADGTEQANCGAPGQPKCAIDETGTPGKVADTAYNTKLDGYKTAMDDLRGTAGGSGDKGFFSGWASFFAAPPIAECVPFQLPSFLNVALGSIDPCAVVGGVRQVMAYIWALLAMWLCVGMVTRTVRGS